MARQAEADELLAEQLSRNSQFLGAEAQARVAGSSVVVVGLGAVGSHAAALLARTGVRRLRLVDPRAVGEASLRAHAVATRADLGLGLADVTRAALLRVVPDTHIDAVGEALTAANASALLGGGGGDGAVSMVVLCVSDADVAALCVARCELAATRCLVVLSAAASAGEKDVAHQRLSHLHDACGCVEARRLAARLRALQASTADGPAPAGGAPMAGASLLVVHSGASRAAKFGGGGGGGGGAGRGGEGGGGGGGGAAGAVESRGAVLAGLGHAAASACLCALAGVPLAPTGGEFSRANREDAHRLLVKREREVFGCDTALRLWPEDIEYVATDVWGGRCPLSGASLSGGTPLALTRWDRRRPAAVDNLLLASRAAAAAHDAAERPFDGIDAGLVAAIERALARAAREREAWAVC